MYEATSRFLQEWRPLLKSEIDARVILVCDAPVLLVSENMFNPLLGYFELRRYNIDTLGGLDGMMSPKHHIPLTLQDLT